MESSGSPSESLIEVHEELDLRSPILIAAFKGWNDAGDAASFAASHLARVWGARRLASIDPEEFYDFQAVRPQVELVDGVTRKITWPENELWGAQIQGGEHDILLLRGVEPSHRWRKFGELVMQMVNKHDVRLVVTLGALLADVPHSRPVHITGTAGDEAVVKRLGLQRSRYEGPTGIVGVLNDAFGRAGIDSVSLWAAVPHYLAVSPNPKAALALVDKVVSLVEVPAEVDDLERASAAYDERVGEIVAADDDVQKYVELLEARADERGREEQIDLSEVVSGDAIAEELERYLRERGS